MTKAQTREKNRRVKQRREFNRERDKLRADASRGQADASCGRELRDWLMMNFPHQVNADNQKNPMSLLREVLRQYQEQVESLRPTILQLRVQVERLKDRK